MDFSKKWVQNQQQSSVYFVILHIIMCMFTIMSPLVNSCVASPKQKFSTLKIHDVLINDVLDNYMIQALVHSMYSVYTVFFGKIHGLYSTGIFSDFFSITLITIIRLILVSMVSIE